MDTTKKYWPAYVTLELPLNIPYYDEDTAAEFEAWANDPNEGAKYIIEQLVKQLQRGIIRPYDKLSVTLDGATEPTANINRQWGI